MFLDFRDYHLIFYAIFGILPSLIWLLYYLSKDMHPERKRDILRIFLWGALMTIPTVFVQMGLNILLKEIPLSLATYNVIYWFLVISLTEEVFKFCVVKFKVLNSPALDEPLDLMLYMVVSALGFAAVENILYLFQPASALLSWEKLVEMTLVLSLVRFVGATFLHTLSSAVVGYFLALEVSSPHKKFLFTESGLIIAVLLHGIYDLLIMKLQDYQTLLSLSSILLMFGFVTFIGFEKLKKMKSVSQIEIEVESTTKITIH